MKKLIFILGIFLISGCAYNPCNTYSYKPKKKRYREFKQKRVQHGTYHYKIDSYTGSAEDYK